MGWGISNFKISLIDLTNTLHSELYLCWRADTKFCSRSGWCNTQAGERRQFVLNYTGWVTECPQC